LKLSQPSLNPWVIEPVTLRALTSIFTVQEREFIKVVVLGTGTPHGPRTIKMKDWESGKGMITAHDRSGLTGGTPTNYDVDLNAGLVFPRKNVFPVPARTTRDDVQRAGNEVIRSSIIMQHNEKISGLYRQLHNLISVQTKITSNRSPSFLLTPPQIGQYTDLLREIIKLEQELSSEEKARQNAITNWTLALLTGRSPSRQTCL